MMISIIIICVSVGVLSALWALYGVWREKRVLERPQLRAEILGHDSGREARQAALKGWLSKNGGAAGAGHKARHEVRVGEGKHLLLRLKTIYESIMNNEAARVMPSLHDLHTLTMQDEMSRRPSCCLRVITSFLLIVGILGTLLGVHGVLNETEVGKEGLKGLKEALEPSMVAVACTVLLLWLRGWYVATLDAYLEKLDLFTMTEIIPLLQPISRVGQHTANFTDRIVNLGEKIDSVGQMAKDMQSFSVDVKKEADEVSGISDKINIAGERVEAIYRSMEENLKESQQRFVDIQRAILAGLETEKNFREHIEQFNKKSDEVTAHCHEAGKQYAKMTSYLADITLQLNEADKIFTSLSGHAVEMKRVGVNVSQYQTELRAILQEIGRVESVMAEMDRMKQQIAESSNVVNDSSKAAAEAKERSEADMATLGGYNDDFSQYVDNEHWELQQTLISLQSRAAKFTQSADDLQKVFEDRSKRLHLANK